MDVPIFIGGREAGSLRVTRSGLYTVLEAQLPAGTGGLTRLWVHGGGKSAYLGVMQPWSAGLWLRRSLSRAELRAFPDPIEFASDQETESGEQAPDSLHNTGSELPEAPPAPEPEEGLVWTRRPDGSLTAFDGVSGLVALPAALRVSNPRVAERVIEGKKYLVFRY